VQAILLIAEQRLHDEQVHEREDDADTGDDDRQASA
jgi:hypothetical protein